MCRCGQNDLLVAAQAAAALPRKMTLLGVWIFVDFLFLSREFSEIFFSEFLSTDGVWFGNGAEEERGSSPLALVADRHPGPAARWWVLTPALTEKRERRRDCWGLRKAAHPSIWDN